MSPEDSSDTGKNGGEPDGPQISDGQQIYHRKVTPEIEEANKSLLRLVANLENRDVTDLPPLYNCIDDMIVNLFSSPPPTEAQAELEFSYYGYRITVDQQGNISLMKLAEQSPAEKANDEE